MTDIFQKRYLNYNIREENKNRFNSLYNQENNRFCGGVVLGHYDRKAIAPPRREASMIIRK